MVRKITWIAIIAFVAINSLAFVHAYKFTHFSKTTKTRTKDPKELSGAERIEILLTGINNPKPRPSSTPSIPYEVVKIKSDVMLEAWHIKVDSAKGTVILFHGYSGEKSMMLSRAEEFQKLGYNTLLVDFMGSGGSEGNSTTIGYTEAREVKDAFDYVRILGDSNIHLFGTSMGAAAILKSIDMYQLDPTSLILECPFGSLYKTIQARFRMMGVPPFPMAAVLTFWGGFQQGYWTFSHNPERYALSVTTPTLLLFGELDDRVSMEETQSIYDHLQGQKKLITYPEAGHQLFTDANKENWKRDVTSFIKSIDPYVTSE